MNNQNKIAVIGGTGKSGKYLVKQLIHQGFHLKILVRNPENHQLSHPLIEVVKGNVADYNSVKELISGCQAVISTLGLGIPPSGPTIFSQGTSNVIEAMKELDVQRYIVATGINVDTPFDTKSSKTAFATKWMRENYPISTANRQLEHEFLVSSTIEWTLVRLPLIEQTDNKGLVKVSLVDCQGDKISTTDLAEFLIDQLSSKMYVKKAPFIWNL
jgi:putative NADH-flavin reductase